MNWTLLKDFRLLWLLNVFTHVGYSFVAPMIDPFLRHDPLHGDARHYDTVAWSLAQGGDFSLEPHRAPLFPLLMSVVYRVVGHEPEVVRVLNGVFVLLGAVFLMPFVVKRFGPRVGRWFLALYALNPIIIFIGGWLYTEALMLMLLGAVVWQYYEARQRSYPLTRVAGIGLLLGLISLTRSNGVLFGGLLALWMAYDAPVGRRLWIAPVALGLMTVLVAPWTYRNYMVWHRFQPVAWAGRALWISNNDLTDGRAMRDEDLTRGVLDGRPIVVQQELKGLNKVEVEEVCGRIGAEWVRTHPAKFVALWPRKLYHTLTPISYSPSSHLIAKPPGRMHLIADVVYFIYLAIVLYGAAVVWRRTWRDTAPYWLFCFTLLFSALVFNGASRYTVPVMPLFAIWFGCAMVHSFAGRTDNE